MADTLCLSCAKCYGDCPWSERDPETKRIKFQPVPGWTAEPTWKRGCGASYHVVACPLYVSDGKDYSAGRGQKPKYDVRAVSDCLRAGMTDREIMRRTRIQSDSTLREYADGAPVYDLWECSECGEEVRGNDVPDTHPWCHSCGTKMDTDG